jgi:YD repeat-containing protein
LAVQPEIQALAAGLDNDPLLIYDYVLNNYDTVPVYGQLKNPRDTVLSRRGNPFDQAALLSDLLRAAGYETEYVLGIIQLPVAQAMNWVGADTPAVLAGVLDAGGIYREVVGDVLRLKHVWLRAKVAGTWYSLDPSMKPYTYTQGMDLGAILGYNRATYMAAALSGATVTADYAENLNTANIEAQLAQYATNLAQYLRNNAPFASLADAVGGRRIVPQTVAALPTQLPYTVQQVLGTFTDLPADLQYALHVELPGLNYQTTIPAIAGDRVTITYVGATEADQSAIAAAGGIDHVYPAYTVNMVPELRVGGVLVATGSPPPLGSTQTVSTTVATPYFIGDTRVVWPTRSNRLTVGAFYAFPMSVEGISEEALRRHHGLLETYSAAGLAEESEPVRGESLYLIGTSYFNQIEACARLDAGLARVVFFRQMLSAFTSQNLVVTEWTSVGGTPQPARVAWGSYGINVVPGNRTLRSASGDGQAARAFETQMEQRASAAEHAILERLQGNPAISTVRALALTNAAHTPIYRLDSSNIEALLPGLDCSPVLRDLMRQYVAQGRVVIVPQLRLLYNQWQGTGFWVFDPPSGQLDGLISGELVSGSGQSLEGSPTMGGDGTLILSVDMNMLLLLLGLGQQVGTGCNEGCNKADPNAPNNAGKDPVDTTTGAFVHHTADLAFGALGIPIEFVRTYNSASRNAQGPLGYGWTHSYALRLATSSDWARGLGFRTAMDAVAAIAEAYVGLDLASAPVGGLSLERLLVGTLGAHWSTAQVIDNVITVTGAEGEHHQYLRLPDGGYQPGHGDYTMLVANGDGTHTVWDKAGGRTEFDAQGRGTALVDANGNRTSLTYDGQGQLAGVTDAAGQAIDLTYTDGLLTQIVDPAGRTFRYGYDTSGDLITCTDPLGSVTRYAYDAQRQLMTLTDPEGVTFTTNGYDPWHRVMRQVDGRGGIMTIS